MSEYLNDSGLPSGKESACQCRKCKRRRLVPWVWKTPWRRAWLPTPGFLPGKSHGQRSLVGYSPWSRQESDTTEHANFEFWVFECVSGGGKEKHPGGVSLSLSLSKNLFPKDMTQLLDGGEFRGCCSPSHHSWTTSSPRLWFPLGSRTFFQALGVDSCLLCWSPVSPGLVLPTVSWPMPLGPVLRSLSWNTWSVPPSLPGC